MSIKISDIFKGLTEQQLPALVTILTKAKDYAVESGIDDKSLLDTRLYEDMHPLSWQIQTTLELLLRGSARISGGEPEGLELQENDFAGLINRVEAIKLELEELDGATLDKNAQTVFKLPIGPEAFLELSGNDYVIKFLLPNVYFHLTTTYDLLRMKGVPLGKRDYVGPII